MNGQPLVMIDEIEVYEAEEYDYEKQRFVKIWRVSGFWQHRKKQISAISGARKRDHDRGYDLPYKTPYAVLQEIRAPIYALPMSHLVFTLQPREYGNYVLYKTSYQDQEITIIVHPDYFMVRADWITLSRKFYSATMSYRLEKGVYVGKDEYTAPTGGGMTWDVTSAAKRERNTLFAQILASFLAQHSESIGIACELDRLHKIEKIRTEITALEKQLEEKRDSLVLLENAAPVAAQEG